VSAAPSHQAALRPLPAPAPGLATLFARWRTAVWLGWQIESNWADPLVFVVYSVLRPLATALLLGFMYRAVSGVAMRPAAFAGLYVASAFHQYVTRVSVGMGWTVVEEREEYETMKHVYTSPVGIFVHLLGRSVMKIALATVGTVLSLAAGWTLIGVRWDWARVPVLEFALVFALGLGATLAFGFLMAGWTLMLPRIAMSLLEGTAVALQLLCGVIFPVDLLPRGLQEVALALPLTWWYEALRRVLLGRGASQRLASLPDGALLAILAALTAVWMVAARWGYRACERRARRLGRLDQTTLF
jgi:ABC-2 type transport system permease protein